VKKCKVWDSNLILLFPGPKVTGTSCCTEGAHKPGTLSTLDEQCAYQLGPQSLPGFFHGSHRDLVVLCVLFTHQASDLNTVSHTHTQISATALWHMRNECCRRRFEAMLHPAPSMACGDSSGLRDLCELERGLEIRLSCYHFICLTSISWNNFVLVLSFLQVSVS
jgi:hypothetical protein